MSRELDKLIAEKVMGFSGHEDDGEGFCEECGEQMLEYQQLYWDQNAWLRKIRPRPTGTQCFGKRYSSNIAAAWQVVEKFRRGDIQHNMAAACVDLMITDYPEEAGDCFCRIYGPTCAEVSAQAKEMPLAICLAALKALGLTSPLIPAK